ncbi:MULTISPECIES: hypothetical protein [unclassified Aureimonas]|uniref:hypothetical protein n=1 Tax=unclassified Aureimonas TaxID=2615206 RepID=UPI0006FCDD9A|nr:MULTISPECIES: hypothetical protein [unclassified Aureimonas]KQT69720.1 hypothetical protein ASG62_00915 [Aureimonas sp. Leaf427]KQT76128.1 hypothetical protein ASG54_15305 [Aureimonas sp. Leaf460]
MKKLILAATVATFMIPAASFAQTATDNATTASTDLTGNYTIVNNLAAQNPTNTKTDMAQVQRTIDANPGLAEALKNNGINTADIGSIQIKPNGQVELYGKGS